jgi:hypothetical protein
MLGMLATTFQMQTDFFETDFLPTLLGLGAWDDRNWTSRIAIEKNLAEMEAAAVLLDARKYIGRPRSLRVEIVPTTGKSGKPFPSKLHAKVTLIVHEKAVRLIVGSANLTEPGHRLNREVVAMLSKPEVKARFLSTGVETAGSTPEQLAAGKRFGALLADERDRAKEIIEDFMIAANGVVARFLEGHGFPVMRRVVRLPERWQRIVEIAVEDMTPVDYGTVLFYYEPVG